MAVMTHAQNHHRTADYRDLTADQQTQLDHFYELADDTIDAGDYNGWMLAAANLVGIHIPYGGEVLKCACTCVCPVIFDNADPDARTIEESYGFNLPIRQCPTCADRHPAPSAD